MNRKHGCVWYFVTQKVTKPLVQHVAKNITLIKKDFQRNYNSAIFRNYSFI